jgi:hypothetical protein
MYVCMCVCMYVCMLYNDVVVAYVQATHSANTYAVVNEQLPSEVSFQISVLGMNFDPPGVTLDPPILL